MRDDLEVGDELEAGGSQELDLRALFDFVRRRGLTVLLVALPLLIPASIFPFLLKHYYEATSTVAIQATPKLIDFSGGEGGPGGMGLNRSQTAIESALTTVANSDAVLGQVVDQWPAGNVPMRQNLLSFLWAKLQGQSGFMTLSAEQERALRIEFLRSMIAVKLAGGGSYLQMTARDGSAQGATDIANAAADAYVRYFQTQRDEAAKRAVSWLNQQVYDLRTQISSKEATMADLVARNQVSPSAVTRSGDDHDSLATVDGSLQTARIELVGARQRLAEMEPRAARPTDTAADRELKRVRDDYQTALQALESARLRFTPTHPEVRRLEGMVANLSARLGSAGISNAAPFSPAEETEYQSLRSEVARLDAKVRALERARDELVGDGGAKSEAVSRYKRLESELEVDQQMLEVLLTRRNESLLTAADKHPTAAILDYAVTPVWPAGPSRRKYLLLGWAAAVAAGIAVALLRELIDRRVRDTDKIARALGVQALGLIPMVEDKRTVPEHQTGHAPRSAASEGFRNLRTSLVFAMRDVKLHSILVTSAIAGEGKTTTSINLASSFAQMGRRVVLVDADLRRARVDRVFGIARSPGLSEVLQGTARLDDSVQRPDGGSFDVLVAGEPPENPSELLASNHFAQVMADLKSEYDFVVLDSPVLLAVPDALLLAADADGTLLVHKPGSVELRALRRMREDLRRAGARVLGVVFNQVDVKDRMIYPSYLTSPYHESAGKPAPRPPRA